MTTKTILITGATDGIGFEAAKTLAADGHRVLLHGRNAEKLAKAEAAIGAAGSYLADLASLEAATALGAAVAADHPALDVLINNAGVLKPGARTADGFDNRFAVNAFAPFLLTHALKAALGPQSRVVNLSSAAQRPVEIAALKGEKTLSDMDAYAQSKLALTMWSRRAGLAAQAGGPLYVAVNPGSLLATKMVKTGFGVDGSDIRIGADILVRAAVHDSFAGAQGAYFDNDERRFADPHHDALDDAKCDAVVAAIKAAVGRA